jgi:hypothetical protein
MDGETTSERPFNNPSTCLCLGNNGYSHTQSHYGVPCYSSIENYIKVSSSRLHYDKMLQLEPIQYGITLCKVSFNKPKGVQLLKKFPSFIKPKSF